MSDTQDRSTKTASLRHAWLNLWDKHMITGRINQVYRKQHLHINNCINIENKSHDNM